MIFSRLQKLKSTILMNILAFIGAFFLWSVLNIGECDRQAERIFRTNLLNVPQKVQEKIPDSPFIFRRSPVSNIFSLLSSRRSGSNPVPPQLRMSILPLAQIREIAGDYAAEYQPMAEQFVFQKYLRMSLPQRAGPFVS
jgi:hypothetical protein